MEFDTEEYYGGTYESPLEYEELEEDFDMGDYIDYVYESYRDDMLTRGVEDNE